MPTKKACCGRKKSAGSSTLTRALVPFSFLFAQQILSQRKTGKTGKRGKKNVNSRKKNTTRRFRKR